MSGPIEPTQLAVPPAGAAERELVAAVAAALSTLPLPLLQARPVTRARASAWRTAGRRRAMRPLRR